MVDVEGERGRWSNGDNARPELDADGDIVVGREAAFAEANGQLGISEPRRSGRVNSLHLIYRSRSLLETRSLLCSPMAATFAAIAPEAMRG